MGQPCFLVENFFNRRMFPNHLGTGTNGSFGDEETVGAEAFRIADGRRWPGDRWMPLTANAQHTLTVQCDRSRGANMVALDRGHNLAGKEILLRCSNDGGTTWEICFDVVLPAVVGPGTLDDLIGCRTEEGAWLIRFLGREAPLWQLVIPAMGAGLLPQIVGLWLGQGWAPQDGLRFPVAPDQTQFLVDETVSEAGARGRNAAGLVRMDTLNFKAGAQGLFDYELGRYHIQGLFGAGRPMWILYDDEQTHNAVLGIRPGNASLGFQRSADWFYPQASVAWVEHEPVRP
jgi:hypothetical protein